MHVPCLCPHPHIKWALLSCHPHTYVVWIKTPRAPEIVIPATGWVSVAIVLGYDPLSVSSQDSLLYETVINSTQREKGENWMKIGAEHAPEYLLFSCLPPALGFNCHFQQFTGKIHSVSPLANNSGRTDTPLMLNLRRMRI